jgi:lipoate-protein ligase A
MKLYNLGKVPWQDTQLIYHSLAHMGREALSLVSPADPYVCIGFHQDVEQEVDLEFCKAHQIPVFRRDLGGGAVYLDSGQLFFHLILHRDNPLIPSGRSTFYKQFLQPIIDVHHRIGIPAIFKPVNDLLADNRKISGTGAAEIGDCIVFVGNLILDFNYEMMSRVLKVPDEKYRDKVHKTIRENLTTITRELGAEQAGRWDAEILNAMMAEEFSRLLGPMTSVGMDSQLESKMAELKNKLTSDEWLFRKGKKTAGGREVKIKAGMEMIHRMHKAPGGLIRADYVSRDGHFDAVSISGDFFCFPGTAIDTLESMLNGQPINRATEIIQAFYSRNDVETPGIEMKDWSALLKEK